MDPIGSIPLDILPFNCLVGRATESIAYTDTDVDRSWATSSSKCDIQLIEGRRVRQAFGIERGEIHRAYLPPTADIVIGDLVAASDGPYQADHFEVLLVQRWRDHHIEADMRFSEDHTEGNTLSA